LFVELPLASQDVLATNVSVTHNEGVS